jgi:hypothetical protein
MEGYAALGITFESGQSRSTAKETRDHWDRSSWSASSPRSGIVSTFQLVTVSLIARATCG